MEIKRIFSRREEQVRSSEVLDPNEQRVLMAFFNLREASVAEVFSVFLMRIKTESDVILPQEVERISDLLQQRGLIGMSDQEPIVEGAPFFELRRKGKDAIKYIMKNPARFREQITVKV